MEGFKSWMNKSKQEKANDVVSLTLGAAVLAAPTIDKHIEEYKNRDVSPTTTSEKMPSQSELEIALRNDFNEYLNQNESRLNLPNSSITLESIGPVGPDSKILLTFMIEDKQVPVVFDLGDGITEQLNDFVASQGLTQ